MAMPGAESPFLACTIGQNGYTRRMIVALLAAILAAQLYTLWRIEKLMSTGTTAAQALSDLQAQVTAQTTVEASAITLIQSLAAQITAANGVSPAAVEAVVAQFQTSATALAAAVTANTAAAPPATKTA